MQRQYRHFGRALTCFGLLSSLVTLSTANTFVVTNTANGGVGSLRQAMLDANASAGPDTIDLTGVSGAILISSALPFLAGDLTVLGPGRDTLAIDGGGTTSAFAGNVAKLTLRGLEVRNVTGQAGPGIQTYGSLEITDCRFINCIATST